MSSYRKHPFNTQMNVLTDLTDQEVEERISALTESHAQAVKLEDKVDVAAKKLAIERKNLKILRYGQDLIASQIKGRKELRGGVEVMKAVSDKDNAVAFFRLDTEKPTLFKVRAMKPSEFTQPAIDKMTDEISAEQQKQIDRFNG